MNDAPIFVVGIGRSGTTLLRLMLHHHPRIAIPYESHFLTKYQETIRDYGDLQDEANLGRLIDAILAESTLKMWDHEFDRNQVLHGVSERSLAGVIDGIYTQYATAKGKARWGDKSDYLDRLHVINEIFPRAQFIHIIRDGRDVATSVLKLPWGPEDIIRAGQWWNDNVWVARRMGAVLGQERYLEVRYETLVEEPERELRRCCGFIGEEYSPEMLSYYRASDAAIPAERRAQHYRYNSPPDPSRSYAWKREMDPCDVTLFQRQARPMLSELGYEIATPACGQLAIGLRLVKIMARRYRRGVLRPVLSSSPR
jgi:hypothetical protein